MNLKYLVFKNFNEFNQKNKEFISGLSILDYIFEGL
jgi:hypothetical protein